MRSSGSPVSEFPRGWWDGRKSLAGGPFPVDSPVFSFNELEGHVAFVVPIPPSKFLLEMHLGERLIIWCELGHVSPVEFTVGDEDGNRRVVD